MLFTVYCAAVIKQSEIVSIGEGQQMNIGQTVEATEVRLMTKVCADLS
jgi:hypothetical protein